MFYALKPSIWAPALLRRAEMAGAFAVIVHKGDPDAGAVIVKVRTPDGQAVLYRAIRGMDGVRRWLPQGPDDEAVIDATIVKGRAHDPDLWVIEIEDRQGRHFLTEKVEGDL